MTSRKICLSESVKRPRRVILVDEMPFGGLGGAHRVVLNDMRRPRDGNGK